MSALHTGSAALPWVRHDATWIAAVKGLGAGSVNLLLALWLGSALPSATALAERTHKNFDRQRWRQ